MKRAIGFWVKSGVSYDADLVTYMTGLSTPLSVTQKSYLNTFILSLKSGLSITNLSDFFDTLYILAGETAESSYRNLVKRLHDVTAVNSPTWTQYEGSTGDGISTNLYTNYNPAKQGVNYIKASSHNFVGVRTNDLTDSRMLYGRGPYASGSGMSEINIRTTNIQFRNNAFAGAASLSHGGNIVGYWGTSRIDGNGYYYYKNTTGAYKASVAEDIYNGDTRILSNASAQISLNQVCFVSAGRYLNAAEVVVMINAIETYMDARGKGVIA